MIRIDINKNPSPEELSILSEGIKSYNDTIVGAEVAREPDSKFVVIARSDEGTIVGGIRANSYWNYLDIELLWLASSARGDGIGSTLLQKAENHARENGFEYAKVFTTSFQAKGFYQKLGYDLVGTLKDHPKDYETHLLTKQLT